MLEQGPSEQSIIDQCVRERRPLPEKIAKAPELFWGLELFYLAWRELDTTRQVAFAEGPIPWLMIREFCWCHEIDGEQAEDLLYHVRELDNCYLEWRAKKREAQRQKGK